MVGVVKRPYQGFVLGKPLRVRIVILVLMENSQLRWNVEISARELRRQRSRDEIIKYQCTFAKQCTRAIRALTFHFRLMHTPLRSSLCGEPCHRSSMSRKARKVSLIVLIIAQIWVVVRRMIVCAFKRFAPWALSASLQSPCLMHWIATLHCNVAESWPNM